MENVQKFTELGNTYYGDNGVYTSEYNLLYGKLVPSIGSAETLHGELIRGISRLGHEYNNNGNGNLIELGEETEWVDCHNCGGSGVEEGDYDEENDEYEEIECSCCYGDGGEDEIMESEIVINEYYKKFIELIKTSVPNIEPSVSNLLNFLNSGNGCTFSPTESNIYDKLFDKVIFHVLNSNDSELPSWYNIG